MAIVVLLEGTEAGYLFTIGPLKTGISFRFLRLSRE
jgi:hypothetical protein